MLFSTKPDSNRPNTWFLQKIKAFASRQFYIEIWYTTKYQILEINEKGKESVDIKTRKYEIVKKINININKNDNNLRISLI